MSGAAWIGLIVVFGSLRFIWGSPTWWVLKRLSPTKRLFEEEIEQSEAEKARGRSLEWWKRSVGFLGLLVAHGAFSLSIGVVLWIWLATTPAPFHLSGTSAISAIAAWLVLVLGPCVHAVVHSIRGENRKSGDTRAAPLIAGVVSTLAVGLPLLLVYLVAPRGMHLYWAFAALLELAWYVVARARGAAATATLFM